MTALGFAVAPRIGHPDRSSPRIRYFADAARADSLEHLAGSLTMTADEGHDRTLDQLWVVSQLALGKHELVRAALVLFGVAVVFALGAVVGNSVTQ